MKTSLLWWCSCLLLLLVDILDAVAGSYGSKLCMRTDASVLHGKFPRHTMCAELHLTIRRLLKILDIRHRRATNLYDEALRRHHHLQQDLRNA